MLHYMHLFMDRLESSWNSVSSARICASRFYSLTESSSSLICCSLARQVYVTGALRGSPIQIDQLLRGEGDTGKSRGERQLTAFRNPTPPSARAELTRQGELYAFVELGALRERYTAIEVHREENRALERRAASADDSELRETVVHLEAEVEAVRAERKARCVSLTFVLYFRCVPHI
jgi:hypothetical protein